MYSLVEWLLVLRWMIGYWILNYYLLLHSNILITTFCSFNYTVYGYILRDEIKMLSYILISSKALVTNALHRRSSLVYKCVYRYSTRVLPLEVSTLRSRLEKWLWWQWSLISVFVHRILTLLVHPVTLYNMFYCITFRIYLFLHA